MCNTVDSAQWSTVHAVHCKTSGVHAIHAAAACVFVYSDTDGAVYRAGDQVGIMITQMLTHTMRGPRLYYTIFRLA